MWKETELSSNPSGASSWLRGPEPVSPCTPPQLQVSHLCDGAAAAPACQADPPRGPHHHCLSV